LTNRSIPRKDPESPEQSSLESEISEEDEQTLDRFEGVAAGGYRKAMLAVSFDGGEVLAMVYIDPVTAEGVPKQEYVGRINAGLLDAGLLDDGLSAGYVAGSIRKFIPPGP
jgi:hypothetical protein